MELSRKCASEENKSDSKPGKRIDYISWSEMHMSIAIIASLRSKDPVTQVGSVIVNPNEQKIVSIGYNGFPRGISDDVFPWNRPISDKDEDILNSKKLFVVHAEENAILNKVSSNIKGCIVYSTLMPCHQCARLLIQEGISEVVYLEDRDGLSWRAAKMLFDEVGITYRKYEGKILKTDLS